MNTFKRDFEMRYGVSPETKPEDWPSIEQQQNYWDQKDREKSLEKETPKDPNEHSQTGNALELSELQKEANWEAYREALRLLELAEANAQRLADALTVAANWLSRSVRIDDQEQAQDAREALKAFQEQQDFQE